MRQIHPKQPKRPRRLTEAQLDKIKARIARRVQLINDAAAQAEADKIDAAYEAHRDDGTPLLAPDSTTHHAAKAKVQP